MKRVHGIAISSPEAQSRALLFGEVIDPVEPDKPDADQIEQDDIVRD
jgi:hypothetical protein